MSAPTGMEGEGSPNDDGREPIRARLRRLALLRAAWRALAPSAMASHGEAVRQRSCAIREVLAERTAAPDADAGAPLEEIDDRLEQLARILRHLAVTLPLAQLRSTWPGMVGERRQDLLALLDVLLEERSVLDSQIPRLDYLITLLATERANGRCRIVHDPVTLTPRLRGLCHECESEFGGRCEGLDLEFFAAASHETSDETWIPGLHRLRHRKLEMGPRMLVPRVLRAVVTYNAAMWNLAEERMDALQGTDALLDEMDLFGSADHADEGPLAVANGVGPEASVFACEPLGRIARSVCRRLAEDRPRANDADRVAWALDLAEVTDDESDALGDVADRGARAAEGATVLVGVLCRSLPVLGHELQEMGVDPRRLEGDWIGELDGEIKRRTNALFASSDLDGARALSALRTKYLYAPVSELPRRWRRSGVVRSAAPALERSDEVREVLREARRAPAESLRPARALPAAVARGRRWLPALASACVVALAATNLVGLRSGSLNILSGEESRDLSPYLASGYRGAEGAGLLFVGTLAEAWDRLDGDLRRREARVLADRLEARGVREVQLYDTERRLRVHLVAGRLELPLLEGRHASPAR